MLRDVCNLAKEQQQRNQTTDRMQIWAKWRKKGDEWQEQQQYCYITHKSRTNKKKALRREQNKTDANREDGCMVLLSAFHVWNHLNMSKKMSKSVWCGPACTFLYYLHITMDAAWMWYLHLTASATQTHQTHVIWIIQTQFYFTCVCAVSFFRQMF